MRNILFTGDTPEKILNKTKTMTARHWLISPPQVGEIVTASTGRKKETRFAKLKITKVWEWDPLTITSNLSNEELNIIGELEGFDSWFEFYHAYKSLNAWDWDNPRRKHWFIEFEVVERLC